MDGIPPVFIPSWQAQRETEEPHLAEEGEGADHVLIKKEQGEEAGHENHQVSRIARYRNKSIGQSYRKDITNGAVEDAQLMYLRSVYVGKR